MHSRIQRSKLLYELKICFHSFSILLVFIMCVKSSFTLLKERETDE